jgi:hypothetical protein
MDDLKTAFRRETDSWNPPNGDFGTVRRLGIRRIRRKRLLVAAAAGLCSIVVSALLIDGIGRLSGGSDNAKERADVASAQWTTRKDTATGLFISERKIADSTFDIEISDGFVWVLGCVQDCRGSERELLRIDPATATVGASTSIEGAIDLTVAHGSAWVVNFDDDSVIRLDVDTLEVETTIPLPLPPGSQFADQRYVPTHSTADAENVWVDSNRGFLTRISAASSEVSGTFRVADIGPAEMVAAHQALWVTGPVDGVLVVDPDSGQTARLDQVRVGDGVLVTSSVDADDDAIWVAGNIAVREHGDYTSTERGALARVDADTGATLDVRQLPHTARISVDGATAWAIDGLGRMWQLDSTSGQPLTQGPLPVADGPDAIDAAYDAAWVARQDGTLVRVSASQP